MSSVGALVAAAAVVLFALYVEFWNWARIRVMSRRGDAEELTEARRAAFLSRIAFAVMVLVLVVIAVGLAL